ncbi:MAG: carboxypeptidase regulatory-like domain-containing protein [Thermoanaerobaculia bacterium]
MKLLPRSLPWRLLGLAALALALAAPPAWAQGTTTGTLSGVVTDEQGETALPGATVTAVHTPTGTRYSVTSGQDGRFSIQNVRVGGPYAVTVEMDGFKTKEQSDVFVNLGEDRTLRFGLALASVEETVTVVAESNPLINASRTGSASNVNLEQISTLPTVNRALEDYARLNPFFSSVSTNDGQSSLTVAGRNNRYNNIQIDGAVNNDLFGLANTGTPGGQAETQPISLDAIQELQLLVSPYDVRQGGFSGGGVNAITKSGTNAFRGSAYYFRANDDLIGDGAQGRPFGKLKEDQYGISVSGPILRDKLFFFANGEISRKDRPSGFSIGGSSGQDFGQRSAAERVRNTLIQRYGYDPGGFDEVTRTTDSDKYFVRLDWNVASAHQLTLRHNYVDATNDILPQSPTLYRFPDNTYHLTDKTNSSVLQLNSIFGNDWFNEGRLTYQTIKDRRAGDKAIAGISIRNLRGPSGEQRFEIGTERFSTANALDQDIFELTDDVTWIKGDHTFTFGTHNEFFSFDNLFIRDNFGFYTFNSVEDFERGWANQFDYSFATNPNTPKKAAKFDVAQYGLYVADKWSLRPNFTLTLGLRADVPYFPDKPTRNPQSEAFGFRTDEVPDGNVSYSPRIGFNWDILSNGKQQLRGGIGYFSGRTPYVWVSNQYANTGIEFTRLTARVNGTVTATNNIRYISDPNAQPRSLGGAATNEIDVTDPNFDFPSVLRTSLGYDFDLGLWGMIASAEVVYAQTEKDILYQNLNYVPTGQTLFDGRPTFKRKDTRLSDVILLTNTHKGKQLNAALKVEKPFRNNWFASVSYAYGDAKSVIDGTSSQAISNWRFVYVKGDPNHPDLAQSDFDVTHRLNAAFTYRLAFSERWPTNISLFYNAQSGRPYSTTFSNDINGDAQDNDLLFVPRSQSDVLFCVTCSATSLAGELANSALQSAQWAAFDSYVRTDDGLDSSRGKIVDRNASRAPWVHLLDFHLDQTIPISVVDTKITFDILNLGNLIDKNSGQVYFSNFNEVSPVRLQGVDARTGKPIYQLQFSDPSRRFVRDDLRSRWQAKIGLRISF